MLKVTTEYTDETEHQKISTDVTSYLFSLSLISESSDGSLLLAAFRGLIKIHTFYSIKNCKILIV
jgi:hypothetical protein